MRYKIEYNIWAEGSNPNVKIESPIFEYPNPIISEQSMNIILPNIDLSMSVGGVSHKVVEGYAELYVRGYRDHEKSLEQTIEKVKCAFAKLNKSGGGE